MSKQASKKTETAQPSAPKSSKTTKTPKPATEPAPVAATSSKKSTKKQTVVVPENEVIVSSETPAAPAEVQVAATEYTDFMAKLQQVSSLLSSLKTEFRSLEKKAVRELRIANKANAKRKRKTGNRSPSGFVKPTLISVELSTFLGKEAGSEMARTQVTREINEYIRTHNLQDKTNGRKINADASLTALLKLKDGDELTYFNLQRYMSPHFAKAGVAPVAPVAPVASA